MPRLPFAPLLRDKMEFEDFLQIVFGCILTFVLCKWYKSITPRQQ